MDDLIRHTQTHSARRDFEVFWINFQFYLLVSPCIGLVCQCVLCVCVSAYSLLMRFNFVQRETFYYSSVVCHRNVIASAADHPTDHSGTSKVDG